MTAHTLPAPAPTITVPQAPTCQGCIAHQEPPTPATWRTWIPRTEIYANVCDRHMRTHGSPAIRSLTARIVVLSHV